MTESKQLGIGACERGIALKQQLLALENQYRKSMILQSIPTDKVVKYKIQSHKGKFYKNKNRMNKRVLSSQFMGSRAQVFLSQQSSHSIEKEHQKKQLQHYKKQNALLKKQLDQLKSVYNQTRKQLNMYRSMTTKKITSKQQKDVQINEVFEMQQQKIFDLETELQILRDKYNRSLLSSGSVKETEYATKCKQLENRLISCENDYQREISYFKQKLARHNAEEFAIEKSKSSNFMSSVSSELKPFSKKLNRIEKSDLSKPDIYK